MAENKDKNQNGYTGAYSRIKRIRHIIVTILVLFVIFAVFSYREDLTIENFRYLMKYVNVKPVVLGSEEKAQITFEPDSATVTASFKEDLVVLNKSSLKIYDLTSKEILNSDLALLTPAVSVGEKYFAVYDLGSKYVGIFNSFSKLWENNFDYPVYDVALDHKGNFCVVTAIKDYTSALKVYNNSFENIFNWKSADKYAVTADIHTDGDVYMSVGTIRNTTSGDMLSSLIILSASSDKVIKTVDFEGELAVKIRFNDEGNIVFLTDKALRFYSIDGKLKNEYFFNSKTLRKFDTGSDKTVLVLNENMVGKEHHLIIFDGDGNTYMECDVNSEITDLCISEAFTFVLGVEDITVIDLKQKKQKSYAAERSYRSVELLDEENVYLVYEGEALAVGVSK
ncbi:MAG: hypothetical protein E7582_04250 [Ruminococcaceae bacterium]|nr:hypothetical protein [Oscillospiraceae bacterium]